MSVTTFQSLTENEAKNILFLVQLGGHCIGSLVCSSGKKENHYYYNDRYYKVIEYDGETSIEVMKYAD